MATMRQKKLAREIVDNLKRKSPKNKRELLVSSGYAPISAESVPSKLIDQKGVKEELKTLGFDEESAKRVVSEILHSDTVEPATRLRAAAEVFKVHGTYAAEKTFNLTASANVDDLKQIIQQDMLRFRSK